MKNFKEINNPLGDFEAGYDGTFPVVNITVPSKNSHPFIFPGAIIVECLSPKI